MNKSTRIAALVNSLENAHGSCHQMDNRGGKLKINEHIISKYANRTFYELIQYALVEGYSLDIHIIK